MLFPECVVNQDFDIVLNSPDLNPCDYFHWELLKEMIFPKCPQTLLELHVLTIDACNEITEDMCHHMINLGVCVQEVAQRDDVYTLNMRYTERSPCSQSSCILIFCISVKTKILDNFVCHPVALYFYTNSLVSKHR